MELREIADALVAGCREGREDENLDRLHAADAVSVEAVDFGGGREVHGVAGIRAKHAQWNEMFEVLGHRASDPMPHGDDRFAVVFDARTRHRESGAVEEMREVGLYHVADGRIVREEFFYPADA